MILDKEVEIIVGCNSIKHYIELGYKAKLFKILNIKIEHLSIGSHVKIRSKCDVCGQECYSVYKDYIKITKNLTDDYCCSRKCAQNKIEKTNLNKYGFKSFFQNEVVKEKIKKSWDKKSDDEINIITDKRKQTCLKNHGVEQPMQSKAIRNKSKQTCLKNHGVEYPTQSKEIREKGKSKNLQNIGVEYPMQSEQVKLKSQETCLKNNGVKYPMQNINIQNKSEQTCLKNYGVKHPSQNKKIKLKQEETCLKNHGVENPMQNELIKEKAKQTCLKNYGVEHSLQNKKLFEKQQKSGKKIKTHEQTCLTYRGTYELHFLDYCVKNNIKIGKIKSIRYEFEGKKRVYHPDFYLGEKNLIIEIKSSYYYEKDLSKNLAKQKACLEQGYNYIFIINKKYDEFITKWFTKIDVK